MNRFSSSGFNNRGERSLANKQEQYLSGMRAIDRNVEAKKDDLEDKGYSKAEIEVKAREYKVQEMEEFNEEYSTVYNKAEEVESSKEIFGLGEGKEVIEVSPEIKERLENCGVIDVEIEGMREDFQNKLAESFEEMNEKYPELNDYISAVKVRELKDEQLAYIVAKQNEKGFTSELYLSKKVFSDENAERRFHRLEQENWKGEKWLAGNGAEGVFKHEMAHALHLKLVADREGVELGTNNREEYIRVIEEFERNAVVSKICYDSIKEQDISPKDIGKELSVYGNSDFGEFFAEAMSEYETQKHPRELACEVHRRYEELVNRRED